MKILYFIAVLFLSKSCFSLEKQIYDIDGNLINVILAEKKEQKLSIGLEFILKEGWKIYWTYPGDVGLPASLSIIEGSKTNLVEIKWPFPKELYEKEVNLVSRVYTDNIILPVDILIKDLVNFKKNNIKFLIDFQICKEICIPVSKKFDLNILPGNYVIKNNKIKLDSYERLIPKNAESSEKFNNKYLSVTKDKIVVTLIKNLELPNFKISDGMAFFVNENVNTTRFEKFEEYENKIVFYLQGLNENQDTNKIKNNSVFFFKVNEELYFWNIVNTDIKTPNLNVKLFTILIISFFGGFILNFMPCVLPVLGLKINSFIQELDNRNGKRIKLASLSIVFGIISTFLFFAIIASLFRFFGKSIGWGMQFQSQSFIIIIITILVLFILNLLGLFEIKIPRFLNRTFNFQDKLQNKSIYLKNYFTGIISTFLATPCTAPFVGTALTIALTQSFFMTFIIFTFMSLGKSLPYLLFVFYPKIIYYFPKPGKWFYYLKYFFASLLFFTVVWLFTIYFNKSLSTETSSEWEDFDKAKLTQYLDNGNSIFVDVTAKWCLTCAVNKNLVLNQKEIVELFKSKDIKLLRADWTNRDENILNYLEEHNRYGIPFNILYTPQNRNGYIFSEILSKSKIREVINESNTTKLKN